MTELDIKPKSIIITISFFIIAIISLYFFKFGQFELGDQATFGQFGDYIGGTLNPFLSFFSILLLIWSIHGQSKQNTLALDALQQAQKFHQEQKLAQKSEKLIKTLEAHLNECDRLLNLPIFFIKTIFYQNQH
jgi:dolichol kinase